jgi:hypothetical protein
MYLHLLPLINRVFDSDISKLAFSLNHLSSHERIWVLQQVDARTKMRQKLPTWLDNHLLFPPSLNLEQSSSEITAQAKLEFVDGKSIWDLTGGFGVDSTFFVKAGLELTHIEPNYSLQELFSHNISTLYPNSSVNCVNKLCEEFLSENTYKQVDTIFIDPSRRDKNQQKVFLLSDYSPNLFEILPDLFNSSSTILIKVSPMLDLNYLIQELPFVFCIAIISVKNECKELLIKLKRGFSGTPEIITLNYTTENSEQRFSFSLDDLQPAKQNIPESIEHLENLYLYDVNASIHKAQAYSIIQNHFELSPISAQTHVFLSTKELSRFPGRSFKVQAVFPYKKSALNSSIKEHGVNIVPRNFPDSEFQLRSKLGIKKNGTQYLYAVRNRENKPILIWCNPL